MPVADPHSNHYLVDPVMGLRLGRWVVGLSPLMFVARERHAASISL